MPWWRAFGACSRAAPDSDRRLSGRRARIAGPEVHPMAVETRTPAFTDSPRTERLAAFEASRRRATEWLLSQLNADGSLGDPSEGYFFYRAPWTFSLVGETGAASAVCGWIRRNMLTPDGRIDGPFRVVRDAWAYRDS